LTPRTANGWPRIQFFQGKTPQEFYRMLSNIGPVQLLIVLLIVLAIFGTKKLRSLGSDLGSAVKGFRSAVADADKEPAEQIGSQSRDADFDNTPVEEPRKEKNSQ
jgi:sec-independent protein translocase protein TatA